MGRAGPVVIIFLAVYAAHRPADDPGPPDLAAGITALCVASAGTMCWAAVGRVRRPFGLVVRIWASVGIVVVATWNVQPLLETWIAQRLLELNGLDAAGLRGYESQLFRNLTTVPLHVIYCALAFSGASVGRVVRYVRPERPRPARS